MRIGVQILEEPSYQGFSVLVDSLSVINIFPSAFISHVVKKRINKKNTYIILAVLRFYAYIIAPTELFWLHA